jgi:hypothetical protein
VAAVKPPGAPRICRYAQEPATTIAAIATPATNAARREPLPGVEVNTFMSGTVTRSRSGGMTISRRRGAAGAGFVAGADLASDAGFGAGDGLLTGEPCVAAEDFIVGAAGDGVGAGDGFVTGADFVAGAACEGVGAANGFAGVDLGAGAACDCVGAGFAPGAGLVAGVCNDMAWRNCRMRSALASLCSAVSSVENSLP